MDISASFLSIKNNLKDNVKKLDSSNISYLHLDIMDGIFVSNKTWSFNEIKDIVSNHSKPLDIHLMVSDVIDYINLYSKLNPTFITFHLEATSNPLEIINYVKKLGIKVGISIKPNTNIDLLLNYLPLIDLVLIMSVEPGYGGQKFIESSVEKIEKLYNLKLTNNYNYMIEVDGGINNHNIEKCKHCDIVVVGSYITNSNNYNEQISKLF